MQRPNVPPSDGSSDWKGAFVARLVRLCPDLGTETAAEVSEAALMTNEGMPPWIAAAEWAALWVRRVRAEAGTAAEARSPASVTAYRQPRPGSSMSAAPKIRASAGARRSAKSAGARS